MNPLTYLLINIGTISIPLLLSFEKRVQYASKWKALFPAILFAGIIFIAWDVAFHQMGVWSFNDSYLLGIRFFGLPLEEFLFFLTVPYACVFIYEVLRYFVPFHPIDEKVYIPSIFFSILLIALAFVNLERIYTFITLLTTGAFLGGLSINRVPYLGLFYRAFTIVVIPFFLVNGLLTYLPVVEYNRLEQTGILMGSIPVEDLCYGFLLILLVIVVFEKGLNRQSE